MPAVRRPKPKPLPPPPVKRCFRVRYAVCCVLAAGLGVCLVRWHGQLERDIPKATAEVPSVPPVPPVSVTVAAPGPPAVPEPPPVTPRPAVLIDPGHGGADPGTIGNGHLEKTWTLSIGLELAAELRVRGWPVEMTRADDSTLPLMERSQYANLGPRLALVSLHLNAGGPEASGIETYYAWPKNPEIMVRIDAAHRVPEGRLVLDDRGRLLAESIQEKVCAATGARNRGVRNQPQLSVISRTLVPAVLVECGFLTHGEEGESIRTAEYRTKLVRGLADGLERWLHLAAEPGFGLSDVAEGTRPVIAPGTENP